MNLVLQPSSWRRLWPTTSWWTLCCNLPVGEGFGQLQADEPCLATCPLNSSEPYVATYPWRRVSQSTCCLTSIIWRKLICSVWLEHKSEQNCLRVQVTLLFSTWLVVWGREEDLFFTKGKSERRNWTQQITFIFRAGSHYATSDKATSFRGGNLLI